MQGCEKSRQSLLDGYMYQISNEKFGLFVSELRKEEGTIMEKMQGNCDCQSEGWNRL